jgi:transposase-like protein
MDYPGNQIEFENMFCDEQKCLDYILKFKWNGGFVCPKCGHDSYWHTTRKRIVCAICNYQTTPLAETIFEQTNKPLSLWFRAIWWMVAQKSGVSAKGLQKILGIGSYKTAWTWLQKLRLLTVNPERQKLSGIIEVDETLVGGKKTGKRGRGAEGKTLVVIAIEILEKSTGRIRMAKVSSATKKNLLSFIEENIEKGSTIITDGLHSYKTLTSNGYQHIIERGVVKYPNEELLPNAHRVASLLKRWLLGTHQNFVSPEKLPGYLNEFVFRYNRRTSNSRGLLFKRIIEQAVNHKPVQYSEI